MKEIHKQIIAGLAASVCLGLFSYWTRDAFGVNLLMSAIIGFAIYILLPHTPDPRDVKLALGVTQAQLNDALERIDVYIDAFDELKKRSREESLRDAIRRIIILLKNISAKFKQDPKDLQMPCTTLFMDQYLPRSYRLLKDYVRLWNHATERAVRAKLKPTETATDRVVSGFTAFYRQCLLDGIVDLKAGNASLKRVLDTDLAAYGHTREWGDESDPTAQPAESAAGR